MSDAIAWQVTDGPYTGTVHEANADGVHLWEITHADAGTIISRSAKRKSAAISAASEKLMTYAREGHD